MQIEYVVIYIFQISLFLWTLVAKFEIMIKIQVIAQLKDSEMCLTNK